MRGVRSSGILRAKDGRLYIDDIPLETAVKDIIGTYVSFNMQELVGVPYPIDSAILPLVVALADLDIHTISSCGGHLDRELRYPYVSFFYDERKDPPIMDYYEILCLHEMNWTIEVTRPYVATIRSRTKPKTALELDQVQGEALELARKITQAHSRQTT